MATSHASSSLQLEASPKDLMQVLSILNEKNKREQEIQQQQQHQQYPYPQSHLQHDDQHKYEQRQLDESEREAEKIQTPQCMELSQIDLIYRAEGNANLVLALPQFKKVLRLPKFSKNSKQRQPEQQTKYQETQHCQKSSPKYKLPQKQQLKQPERIYQQEPNKTTGQQENEIDAVGILTMDHYVAYINIIRCLVGNEFVFEADAVAVPNPTDRQWINEHIQPYRPDNRLDKEFGGHFGLLLPDATQLPAELNFLYSNFQPATVIAATKTLHCSYNSNISDKSCSNKSNNIFGSDTFAIEIKPKQGWLLPNDVNNLFDIKPKIIQTTEPPSLPETKKALKAAGAAATTTTEANALKTLTDSEYCTAIQKEASETIVATTSTTTLKSVRTRIAQTSQTEVAKTKSCCSGGNTRQTTTTPSDVKISHPLYDKADPRCRYCCMQFLKVKQKKISKRNQYCPIDLFSGSSVRMLKALHALFECPQNNLRVFKNGHLFFDDQTSRKNNLNELFSSDKLQLIKHLLVTCLLREFENKEKAKNVEKEQINKDTKQQLLSSTVSLVSVGGVGGAVCGKQEDESRVAAGVADGQPHSSVTSGKKHKQNSTIPKKNTKTEVTKVKSTLTSAEPIVSMGNTLMSASDNSTHCLQQINEAEVPCLPKNCVLQKILHLQTLAKNNFQFMLEHKYADKSEKTYDIVGTLLKKSSKTHTDELTICQLSPEEQYILAATALDCSIMITFCAIENVVEDKRIEGKGSFIESPYVVSIFGMTFLTKVTILDLDPKTDAHFSKYCLQTKEIVDAMNELDVLKNIKFSDGKVKPKK